MARDYSLSVAAAMWRYAEDCADKERRNTIMRTKTDDTERAAFEAWVTGQYCRYGEPNLTRAYMYGYVSQVTSNDDHPQYASIQMLWDAWQARAAVEADRCEYLDTLKLARAIVNGHRRDNPPEDSVEADRQGRMPSDDERGTSDPIAGLPRAQSVSDEMMDLVDRLGSEYDEVDPRAWEHLLVYAPRLSRHSSSQPAASAQPTKRPYAQSATLGEYGIIPECDTRPDTSAESPKRQQWPFVESPAAFTNRLAVALGEFHDLLPAVRHVLIENPPTFAAPVAQEPVAYMHTVIQDNGEPDQALSFSRDSFPLQGVAGFRSIGVVPLGIVAAQARPDVIPSFDELERRYFPEERKKRLEWEAEQRALISRGSTLDAQAHPSAQDREDAERWREVAERFDQAKTSACERVLEALGLDGADAAKSLDLVIDAARAAKGADHD